MLICTRTFRRRIFCKTLSLDKKAVRGQIQISGKHVIFSGQRPAAPENYKELKFFESGELKTSPRNLNEVVSSPNQNVNILEIHICREMGC